MKYVRKKIYRMMAAVMLLAVLVQSTAFAEETARNTNINYGSQSVNTVSDPDGGIDRHGTV